MFNEKKGSLQEYEIIAKRRDKLPARYDVHVEPGLEIFSTKVKIKKIHNTHFIFPTTVAEGA